MMSKKKKKSKKDAVSRLTSFDSPSTRTSSISSEIMNQRFSGQLLKYTNVVKGWQYRWFLLDSNTGMLHYFMSESGSTGNPRGSIHLQGALICPSDEDSHTFTVNSSSGEAFKLRATDARARQEWVNRLRSVAELHSNVVKNVGPRNPFGMFLHSGVFVHGSHIHSPATSESFNSAKEHLMDAEQKCLTICKTINILPAQGPLSYIDPHLLILKACSQSLIATLKECVDVLQLVFAADCGFQSSSAMSLDSRMQGASFVSHIKKK